MDRISGAGHVDHLFVPEDVGTSRPPTEITAEWLNGVQEENLGVIEGSGQTPDVNDNLQVFKGIKKIFRKLLGAVSAAGGTADAITAVYDPAITGLTDGLELEVRCPNTNATAAPTFTPASGVILAETIVKGNNVALVAGDVPLRAKLKWDATLTKWVLLNPATGVAVATAGNDGSAADNSNKPASTSWIRNAMATLAIAAGFVYSWGVNGYIKFPTWLGAWIVQWGQLGDSAWVANTPRWISFPVTFPNTVFQVVAGSTNANYWGGAYVSSSPDKTTAGFAACMSGGGAQTFNYLAVGR